MNGLGPSQHTAYNPDFPGYNPEFPTTDNDIVMASLQQTTPPQQATPPKRILSLSLNSMPSSSNTAVTPPRPLSLSLESTPSSSTPKKIAFKILNELERIGLGT